MFPNEAEFERYIPSAAPTCLNDLDSRLMMYSDQRIEVWYAPLGKQTQNPLIWILGITPGWNQMRIAYEGAANILSAGRSIEEAANAKKPNVAFAGSMRRNLVSMLDEIGVSKRLGINSSNELFGSEYLRTGSVLRYPVFKDRRNYTGSNPFPTKHNFLKEMLDVILKEDLESVDHCLIIPLGKSVEMALAYSVEKGRVDPSRILFGFPHPSGANGHRIQQFNKNKKHFKGMVDNWFGGVIHQTDKVMTHD